MGARESRIPKYRSIVFSLEEDILQGVLGDCDACPSARQLAESFEVNPSTAAKALEVLYRRGVLFRRPGAIHGVSIGAQQRIRARRIADFERNFIRPFLEEATRLGIAHVELLFLLGSRQCEEPGLS